jgi:transposase-like protein
VTRREQTLAEECPRCEGQKYDRGSCSLCGNLGWLCPECAGRLERTPVYSRGHPTFRCTEYRALVADESGEPVSSAKLIPLKRPKP